MYEEEDKKFQEGDTVQLKSGGPDMTVKEWCKVYKAWECQWFDGKRLREARFAENQLRVPPKETATPLQSSTDGPQPHS